MKHYEYKRKNRKRIDRNNYISGMGIRLHMSSTNPFRYRRVKSAKRFIKLVDGVTCLTIMYETFGYSAYGCKRVECIHREEQTLLERHGEKLCWV